MKILLLAACLLAPALFAQEGAKFTIVPSKTGDITINLNGELFTRYVVSDKVTNKNYLWPVIGPDGSHMTRGYPQTDDIEGEKKDHPHHRSICFGMQDAGGFNTWHEALTFTKNGKVDPKKAAHTGHQVHKRIVSKTTDENSATLVVECENQTPDGEVFLLETRTMKFHLGTNGSRIIDLDIVLTGVKDSLSIKGKKDSGLSVRVAHSMCVDAKQGGAMINSAGDRDKACWGKRVPWVDYYGPVEGKTMGVAILNHPDSFRHPTPWHARTYGLFTANPFALKEVGGEEESGDLELKKGETITLKHRIIFHRGDEKEAGIAEAWEAYSK